MRRTKLRIASLAVGAALLVGGLSTTASAEKRRVVVTLLGGKVVPLTVEATPGLPVDASQLPDLGAPVVAIVDHGPVGPTTATTPPPTVTTTPPTTLTPPATVTTPPIPTTGTGTTGTPGTTTAPAPTTTAPSTTAPSTTGTGTTGTGTTPQPPAIGGLVKPKGQAEGEGLWRAVPRTQRDRTPAGVVDAKRDREAAQYETSDDATPRGAQPTPQTPGYTVAPSVRAPEGVPNFLIEQFRIPPFLLPIYQAAGMQYGVPWQILAAINEIETDYGRNLAVSSAGALGWMQFMPASWEAYGVDANGDGIKDPYNPVDAIFAAARYLKAAGIDRDLKGAIFAYNHADWYVESVLLRARLIGGMPADLVGSLTGITQGRFPVAARATYADALNAERARRRVSQANAAVLVEGDPDRRSINIYARRGAPVIAVNDGRIVKIGENERLGRYIVLQDVFGNRYTYSQLGSIASRHPVLRARPDAERDGAGAIELPERDARPTAPASDGTRRSRATGEAPAARRDGAEARRERERPARSDRGPRIAKERLFANPQRPAAFEHGGARQLEEMQERLTTFEGYFTGTLDLDPEDYVLKPLRRGSTVIAGTVLGRIGKTVDGLAPHVEFTIRPAGRGAPRIDPKPILDGWKLLESTAIYRADHKNVFGRDGSEPSIGQILLMTKEELQARVLANPNVEIYQCGRDDIRAGLIDRRVLATIEFLAASGLKPTISSLQCGHRTYTSSGNVSAHTVGAAVDIAAINGIPISPETQGEGSITDITIRRLLTLQGTMKPHQIISLMTYPGTDNTLAMPDHGDHIHVGFRAVDHPWESARASSVMRPEQWTALVEQLGRIPNPVVPTEPSRYAIRDRDRDDE